MSTLSRFLGGADVPIGDRILLPINMGTQTLFSVQGKEYLRTGVLTQYAAKYAGSIAAAPWMKYYGTQYTADIDYIAKIAENSTGTKVAVRSIQSGPYSSTNWTNWTLRTATASRTWKEVICVNDVFVIVGVGAGAGTIDTSTDGITWTNRHSVGTTPAGTNGGLCYASTAQIWATIIWNDWTSNFGLFTRASADPQGTWTQRGPAAMASATGVKVTCSPTTFVYWVAGNNGVIYTATDGYTVTSRNTGIASDIIDVCWTGTKFIANYTNGSNQQSTDGITWSPITISAETKNYYFASNGAGTVIGRPTTNPSYGQQDYSFVTTDDFASVNTLNTLAKECVGVGWTGQRFLLNAPTYPSRVFMVASPAELAGNPTWIGAREVVQTDSIGGLGNTVTAYMRIL